MISFESLKRFFGHIFKALFTVSSVFALAVSVYVLFYYWNVPDLVAQHRIYFQHDTACQQLATKSIDSCLLVYYDINDANRNYFFKNDQKYHINLELAMPDSSVNRNLGMFMINLKLIDIDGKILFAVSRPALFPYRSTIVRLAQQIFYIVPLVLGLISEVQNLKIDLIDDYHSYERIPFRQVDKLRLELYTYKEIEIISPSQLEITAQMEGIQYFMYFWKYTFGGLVIYSIFSLVLFSIAFVKLCSFLTASNINHSYFTGELFTEEVTSLEQGEHNLTTQVEPAHPQQHQEKLPLQLPKTSFVRADSSSSFDENEDDY